MERLGLGVGAGRSRGVVLKLQVASGSGIRDRDQHLPQWHRAAPTLLAGPSVTRAPGSSRVHRGTGRRVPGRGARHLSHAGVAVACVSAGETGFMVRWAAPGPRPLTPMPFPLLLGKGGGEGAGCAAAGTCDCPRDECVSPGPGARCGGSSGLWLQVQGSRRKAGCPRSGGFCAPEPCPSGNPSDSSSGSSQQWRLSARPGLTSLTSCLQRSG